MRKRKEFKDDSKIWKDFAFEVCHSKLANLSHEYK